MKKFFFSGLIVFSIFVLFNIPQPVFAKCDSASSQHSDPTDCKTKNVCAENCVPDGLGGNFCCPEGKVGGGGGSGWIQFGNPLNSTSFNDFIDKITSIIFIFGIALAPLMILIAAIYWVTSAGDPKKVDQAKSIMIYTAVGLAIALLSRGIVAVVKMALDVSK